ncbi:c-type cytochrome [Taibaiella soli]|uniref:Cytochrome c n=1 Tax=Taibaiella soli TaxID=1649169 RepID=A0A2W2AH00_9BACT|nr:cytochrome c [Taibaiella soli]PZF74765.1 cytochrome c [Taibaiella soli]
MARTNAFFSKRNLFAASICALILASCHFSPKQESSQEKVVRDTSSSAIGQGKFTNVTLTHPLDQQMITAGKSIYDIKCGSCHKLTSEKLVGPGWKGVTDRRRPEWIMNFVTNTDEMINKDAQAQAMLEVCMVRMPNQNLSDNDARNVLEFMRSNDNKN